MNYKMLNRPTDGSISEIIWFDGVVIVYIYFKGIPDQDYKENNNYKMTVIW